MGWIRILGLVFVALFLIVITVHAPPVNKSETVVIREIQTIHQAESQYMSQFGRYATLSELGLKIDDKDGYLFSVKTTLIGYAINANPKVYKQTGPRTFYSDETMMIHQNWSAEPANATSPELR